MTKTATGGAVAPSLICCDLCNIERDLAMLEQLGIERIHVDILDGQFSPSMPIGLETVRQAKAATDLAFDVHLMVRDNEHFVGELEDVAIENMCFHVESAFHVDRILGLIENSGAKAGIALMPATPLSALEYCIDRCEFVLLMLMNPGYAGHAGEEQVAYAEKKVADCHRYLSERERKIPIHVDGRVSFASIPTLVAAGADVLVAGSRSLFSSPDSVTENFKKIQHAISVGVHRRNARD